MTKSLRTLAILLLATSSTRATTPPLTLTLTTGLIQTSSVLTSLPLQPYALPTNLMTVDSPPINGFVPQVVFTLTSQEDAEDFYSVSYTLPASTSSWSPPGNYIPSANPNPYFVATFDTGSQSHILSYADAQRINLEAAGRAGNYTQPITGASGDENADISDALGIYMTGFNNVSSNGSSLSVLTPGTLKGQWNTPILSAQSGSALPNIIGSPMAAQYQTVISNSNTRHLTVNNQTFRSPAVSFQALNTSLPANYVRLTLTVQSPLGVTPDPAFIPSIDNFEDWGDDPTSPGFWGSLFATASASHTAGSSGNQDFLFDTGAEVSVLSEDTAASVGFYTGGPDPSTPDFTVEVAGVGGTTTLVPGFYLNSLSVNTNGGPITWTHVPVLVLDLPDPRDGVGFVPGILGTNLFSDRDLIINGGTTNPFVGISPRITPQWTAAVGGSWSTDANWSLGSPDTADLPANFLSSITSDQTITVDQPTTAGSLTFDNPHRYTLAGPGPLTLQSSFSPATIHVVSGSHTIATPLTLASDTTITIDEPTSTLTITSPISASTISTTKTGPGTLTLTSPSTFAAVTIQQGTLKLTTPSSTATKLTSLTITAGTLDLTTSTLAIDYATTSPADTIRQYLHDNKILSSTAAPNTSIAYIEASLLSPEAASLLAGGPTDSTTLLLKSTLTGDANLDGLLTPDDYALLDRSYAQNLPNPHWSDGDFNDDGTINNQDYLLIDTTYLSTHPFSPTFLAERESQFGPTYVSTLLAAVPEPTSLACLVGILPLLSRRRT